MERLSRCKQFPSSFRAAVASLNSDLHVLANGSPYLYCLRANGEVLASVRYSVGVRHVSPLAMGKTVTFALCCLDNGHVVAASLEDLVFKRCTEKPSQQDADIFKDLLSATNQQSIAQGDDISVTIATDQDPTMSLVQAHLVRNTLVVCQRSKVTGNYSMLIFHSSRTAKCGGHEVPIFTDPPMATYPLTTGVTKVPPKDELIYQSAIFLVGCEDANAPEANTVLTYDLFSKLFGSEVTLSRSSVLLCGCQNGHIYHSTISQIGALLQGAPCDRPHPLPVMYSLGQPVQSIHAVWFPKRETNSLTIDLPVTSSSKHVPNTLILIGRLGKIVLVTSDPPSQRTPSYIEFHVPGPITSSVLVKDHALFYSTPHDVYKIYLEEQCIQKHCDRTDSKLTLLVPEMNFRLPSRVAAIREGAVLLDASSTAGTQDGVQLCALAIDGSLQKVRVRRCEDEGREVRGEGQLAEELKECLQALEVANSRLEQQNKKREEQNKVLTELGQVLTILREVAHTNKSGSTSEHFNISYTPKYEDVGVKFHKPYVDIRLTFTGATPLNRGWSLLVQTRHPHTSHSTHSQLVPLAGLQSGEEMVTRVDLVNFDSIQHTLQCFLHFNAAHLVDGDTTPNSVTLPLSEKTVDLIDFFRKSVQRQLLWLPIRPKRTDEEEFAHSKEIKLTMETVAMVTAEHTTSGNSSNLCHSLLCAVLGREDLAEGIAESEPGTSEVTLCCYDGSKMCLQAYQEEGVTGLVVYCSTEELLREAVQGVRRRL